MRDYRVVLSTDAREQPEEIVRYIKGELGSPIAARNTFEALAAGVSSLHHAPFRSRVVEAEPFRSRGLRRLNVRNYAIFYLVGEESETVRVVQTLYGSASDERLRAPLGGR